MATRQLTELPTSTQGLDSDLYHIRQGATDRSLTGERLKEFVRWTNQNFYSVAGTNAITATAAAETATPSGYFNGMHVIFYRTEENTGASTVNVSGLGAKDVRRSDGTDVLAGDIFGLVELVYIEAPDYFVISDFRNDQRYLQLVGGTLTGDLTIDKDSPDIHLQAALNGLARLRLTENNGADGFVLQNNGNTNSFELVARLLNANETVMSVSRVGGEPVNFSRNLTISKDSPTLRLSSSSAFTSRIDISEGTQGSGGFIQNVGSTNSFEIGTSIAGTDTVLLRSIRGTTDINAPGGIKSSQSPTNAADLTRMDWVLAQIFGTGFAWQDVSGSRAVATVYTNSTGLPIQVAITQLSGTRFTVEVDGVEILEFSDSATRSTACFIVPAGSTYELGGGQIINWAELRT